MLTISEGDITYFDDCVETFIHSALASKHFPDRKMIEGFLREAFSKKEVHLAFDEEKGFVGFICFDSNGMFSHFPYLAMIAVREDYRSMGMGTKLLQYFEDLGFSSAAKIFLTVSDFNVRAKKLYEKRDYKEIAFIPDLYRKGYSEYIMMKERPDPS
ncbi:MAG: GNAT family N-acetyltransferase [Firmicutes bacterium]|nr:GNAT family N-acetyltransferase [Bacillota bacterium]